MTQQIETNDAVRMHGADILGEIAAERGRQVEKWGVQHHPDSTGGEVEHAFGMARYLPGWVNLARSMKARCDRLHHLGRDTWEAILTEEFCEAMAESDPARLREELVQVAAVAVAWIEDIDSRAATA